MSSPGSTYPMPQPTANRLSTSTADVESRGAPAVAFAGTASCGTWTVVAAESVWPLMDQLSGPKKFVLAGSGHIAGVVNPPAAGKYQYWTNAGDASSLDDYVAGATEHKGSWWPDWIEWLRTLDPATVPVDGARVPGEGKHKAIEDAPGRYVRAR